MITATFMIGLLLFAYAVGAGLTALVSGRESDTSELPLPEVGDTVAGHTDDGTAVWVVRTATGSVHVVDAMDPTLEGTPGPGVAWASDWCPAGRYFESPWGARWDEYGALMGGPAHRGLTRRDIPTIDLTRRTLSVAEPVGNPMGRSQEAELVPWTCTGADLVPHDDYADMGTLSRPN